MSLSGVWACVGARLLCPPGSVQRGGGGIGARPSIWGTTADFPPAPPLLCSARCCRPGPVVLPLGGLPTGGAWSGVGGGVVHAESARKQNLSVTVVRDRPPVPPRAATPVRTSPGPRMHGCPCAGRPVGRARGRCAVRAWPLPLCTASCCTHGVCEALPTARCAPLRQRGGRLLVGTRSRRPGVGSAGAERARRAGEREAVLRAPAEGCGGRVGPTKRLYTPRGNAGSVSSLPDTAVVRRVCTAFTPNHRLYCSSSSSHPSRHPAGCMGRCPGARRGWNSADWPTTGPGWRLAPLICRALCTVVFTHSPPPAVRRPQPPVQPRVLTGAQPGGGGFFFRVVLW